VLGDDLIFEEGGVLTASDDLEDIMYDDDVINVLL
jgi:hypothetical protein